MKKVLAIYNNECIISILKDHFKKLRDYKLIISDENDVPAKVRELEPDFLLLDVDYTNTDGIDILKDVKNENNKTNLIILFFTNKSEDYVQVIGLDSGADDFIITSVNRSVFIKRLKTLFDRINSKYSLKMLNPDKIIISKENMIVIKGNDKIQLTKNEFNLFILFSSNENKIVTKEEILNKIWKNKNGDNNNIDVLINSIRKKIGKQHFINVRGRGYKYNPLV